MKQASGMKLQRSHLSWLRFHGRHDDDAQTRKKTSVNCDVALLML